MEQLEQFYEELLQEASKARFINSIEELTDEEKQDFIDFFDSHTNAQNLINWQNKSELTKENLERVVNEVKAKADAKKKEHDKYRLGRKDPLLMFTSRPEMFDILEVNDKWIFAQCKSHAACNFADSFECGGAGAKWCIGWTGNPAHWNSYTKAGMEFVLAYNKLGDPKKEDDLKYMIQIDPSGKTQAWLQSDNYNDTIKLPDFPKFFGLDLDIKSDANGNRDAVIEGTTYVKPPFMASSGNESISGQLKIGKKSFFVFYKEGYGDVSNRISRIEIPEGIETIAEGCFNMNFSDLNYISLPSTLKRINATAFSAPKRHGFTLDIPENVEIIEDTAFNSCIAMSVNFKGNKFKFVSSSNSNMLINPFKNCNLDNNFSFSVKQENHGGDVTIRSLERGHSNIGHVITQKENGHSILLSVKIPSEAVNMEGIRNIINECDIIAPDAYDSSEEIIIPAHVKHITGPLIGDSRKCPATLVIPETVETITCDALKFNYHYWDDARTTVIFEGKNFKFIPSKGKTNLSDPFANSSVVSVQIPEDHPYYKIEVIDDIYYLISTESGSRVLLGAAYGISIHIDKLKLPDNITGIANNVMSTIKFDVKTVIFPETLRYLGRLALSGITCMDKILILSKNINLIGPSALPKADIIIMPPNLKYLGELHTIFQKNWGRAIILTNTNPQDANKFIEAYPNFALSYNPEASTNLKTINGIVSVGNQVIAIPKNVKGDTVIPNNITYIMPQAASHSTNMKSITFASNEVIINNSSFNSCSKVAVVNFPTKVIFEGRWSFAYCKRLTTVNFKPRSVIEFKGEGTFDHCVLLDNVVLPEGLKSLGKNTFTACKSLTQIRLPSSLEDLGQYVFNNTRLCKIVFNGTRAQWLALVKPLKSTRQSDKKILSSLVVCKDGFTLAKNRITTQSALAYKRQIEQNLARYR